MFTAFSKYVGHSFKKASELDADSLLEVEIQGVGSFFKDRGDISSENKSSKFYYVPTLSISSEAKIPRNLPLGYESSKRSELNLGRCAEICMCSRDLVKNILSSFGAEIVRPFIEFCRQLLSRTDSEWYLT